MMGITTTINLDNLIVLEKLGCIVINENEVNEVAEEGVTAEVLKEDNGKIGIS